MPNCCVGPSDMAPIVEEEERVDLGVRLSRWSGLLMKIMRG